LTEAWANYHPSSSLSFQGGKMPEIFQDGSRFLWDEDVRFDGFQQTVARRRAIIHWALHELM